MRIKILRDNPYGIFGFGYSYPDFGLEDDSAEANCIVCGISLLEIYVKIINQIKEANLLEKDFPMLCCFCYNFYTDYEGTVVYKYGNKYIIRCGNYILGTRFSVPVVNNEFTRKFMKKLKRKLYQNTRCE